MCAGRRPWPGMAERHIECRVPEPAGGQRADKVFASRFGDISRARLQRAFAAGAVTFEGEVIDKRFKVRAGGLLRATLTEPDSEGGPRAVEIPLSIVHEDDHLIVVDKPAGMVVHPGSGTGENTLVHALLHHTGGALSRVGAPERPGIVHRLDKETSGLIAVAKTDAVHHCLAAAFSDRRTFKRYAALVHGVPRRSEGTITDPIGRHPVARTKMTVREDGRFARTDWSVERSFGAGATLMDCVIQTGRTHQIRVHLSAAGHPLLGDVSYGFKANRLPGIEVPRVMLHAAALELPNPAGEGELRFRAALPEDFNRLMRRLESEG